MSKIKDVAVWFVPYLNAKKSLELSPLERSPTNCVVSRALNGIYILAHGTLQVACAVGTVWNPVFLGGYALVSAINYYRARK